MDMLDALFPTRCTECGRFGSVLCLQCFPYAPPLTRYLDGFPVIALGAYDGPLRRAVLAMKSGRRDILRAFATRLSPLVTSDEIFVGVPSSRRHAAKRGFNGGEMLAQYLALHSKSTYMKLLRHPNVYSQRGRTGEQRRNARGRYEVVMMPEIPLAMTLVDDVCTTGSTLCDAVAALRASGCEVVKAVVAAIVL